MSITDYHKPGLSGLEMTAIAQGHSEPAAVVRAYPYPFLNDWRKGCWAARPTGKADRDYVFAREFLRGAPDKASGTVRYTLADCGGVGWIVAKDVRGRRALFELRELDWIDHGEVRPSDVLRVVRAGVWDGSKCPSCSVGVLLDDSAYCQPCADGQADAERSKAANAAAPDEVPF